MDEKSCRWCGAPFAGATSRIYCCDECARLASNAKKRDRLRAIRAAQSKEECLPKGPGLDACMKEAERQGISYGKYMVRRAEHGR